MWGVFQKANQSATTAMYWDLVTVTNDIRTARTAVDTFLKYPPLGSFVQAGINNVILCEIIPIDDTVLNV
jgi:hypothetical protein